MIIGRSLNKACGSVVSSVLSWLAERLRGFDSKVLSEGCSGVWIREECPWIQRVACESSSVYHLGRIVSRGGSGQRFHESRVLGLMEQDGAEAKSGSGSRQLDIRAGLS